MDEISSNGFSVFKLNGTTGFWDGNKRERKHLLETFELGNKSEIINSFIFFYTSCIYAENIIKPLLSFAWESNEFGFNRSTIDKAKEAIINSNVLVLIGYSIPFFNRKIDKEIMDSLGRTVSTVYVQDFNSNAVIDRLQSIFDYPGTKFKAIDSTDQFFLPPQL